MRPRTFAIANQKGGVGKTPTASTVAACLAEAGERALVVDLDPQANATSGLGERANGSSSIDLLDGVPLRELAKPTRFVNLDLVPAKPDLAGTAAELARRGDGERYLAEALATDGDYSFVFVDCPPSLGPLTVNALAAADQVLVPMQAEYYALEGLAQLVRSIELVRSRLNTRLRSGGVLLTMVDGRTRLSADVGDEVRRHFGELGLRTTMPRAGAAASSSSAEPATGRSSCRSASTTSVRTRGSRAAASSPRRRPGSPSRFATRDCCSRSSSGRVQRAAMS